MTCEVPVGAVVFLLMTVCAVAATEPVPWDGFVPGHMAVRLESGSVGDELDVQAMLTRAAPDAVLATVPASGGRRAAWNPAHASRLPFEREHGNRGHDPGASSPPGLQDGDQGQRPPEGSAVLREDDLRP